MRMRINARYLIAVAVMLIAAACGSDSGGDATTTTATPAVTTAVTATAATTTATTSVSTTTAPAANNDAQDAAELDPAETCGDLADMVVESVQGVLNVMGDLSSEELYPNEVPIPELVAADERWAAVDAHVRSRSEELPDCGFAELERLFCERRATLDVLGPEGEQFLEHNSPPCDLEDDTEQEDHPATTIES